MKFRAFKISPLLLFATATAIAFGQLVCGTGLYYTAMMAVTIFSIGISYNMLGGISTMSGLAFSVLALRLVVISQIAKILVFQPAEKYMVNPTLTVSVYAVFFVTTVVGVFIYQGVRVPLPRPMEPQSRSQAMVLYAISMPAGIIGITLFNLTNVTYGNASATQHNAVHSEGLAMSGLLLFSIIVAVDHRIRTTNGRHSYGFAVLVPWLVGTFFGFINTQRQLIVAPTLVYFVTCYFHGYRLRRRHYIAAAGGLILFVFVISPLALYTRSAVVNGQFRDRMVVAFRVITTANWKEVSAATNAVSSTASIAAEDYYNLPGTTLLSRFSRIRMDSNLIAACESYHYDFEALDQDLLHQIPYFVDKNKPENDAADFLGRVSGVSNNLSGNTEPDFTLVGDSFGAFGWFGVIAIAMIIMPLTLRVYESMFDMSRPWGTVALASLVLGLPGDLGNLIPTVLLRTPISILIASYAIATIVRMIPVRGDSGHRDFSRHSLGPRSSEFPLN